MQYRLAVIYGPPCVPGLPDSADGGVEDAELVPRSPHLGAHRQGPVCRGRLPCSSHCNNWTWVVEEMIIDCVLRTAESSLT